MDEQVTWKPHLKLLEMLPMILSWPDFLAACTNACKIPLPKQIWESGCTALQIFSSTRELKSTSPNRTIMNTRPRLLGQVLCIPQTSPATFPLALIGEALN